MLPAGVTDRMYPRRFFNWLAPPLRPLEREILAAVENRLSPPLAALLARQIEEINYVQRRLGGLEVGLYVIRRGRVARDSSFRLPTPEREHLLARVVLVDQPSRWVATVHLADGHLASIEYDSPPPDENIEDLVLDVEVYEPIPDDPQQRISDSVLPDWLDSYAEAAGVSRVNPPLSADARRSIIEKLETSLPADYLELVAVCDGADIGSLSLSGLSDAYETRTAEGELIVIGQLDGKGALAVRKPGPVIVFSNYETARS